MDQFSLQHVGDPRGGGLGISGQICRLIVGVRRPMFRQVRDPSVSLTRKFARLSAQTSVILTVVKFSKFVELSSDCARTGADVASAVKCANLRIFGIQRPRRADLSNRQICRFIIAGNASFSDLAVEAI
jgi:hypothetical protein